MLHATFARVREEDVPRLREWLADLSSRRDELAESYRRQGTRHELFYLIEGKTGPILVLLSEFEHPGQASVSFLTSRLPIDVEFKELVQSISLGPAESERIYDSAACLAR